MLLILLLLLLLTTNSPPTSVNCKNYSSIPYPTFANTYVSINFISTCAFASTSIGTTFIPVTCSTIYTSYSSCPFLISMQKFLHVSWSTTQPDPAVVQAGRQAGTTRVPLGACTLLELHFGISVRFDQKPMQLAKAQSQKAQQQWDYK